MSLTIVDEASKMATAPRAATREELPVLDLGPLLRGEPLDALARQLRQACETIGFFYVINHGVPQRVVDDVFAATRRFFALPEAKRLEIKLDDQIGRAHV